MKSKAAAAVVTRAGGVTQPLSVLVPGGRVERGSLRRGVAARRGRGVVASVRLRLVWCWSVGALRGSIRLVPAGCRLATLEMVRNPGYVAAHIRVAQGAL